MHARLCLLFYALNLFLTPAHALMNKSFDDTDEAYITYSANGYWKSAKGGMGLGTHKASIQFFPYALFNFTGIAVYYWAPLFDNDTIIDFSLDGGPSSSVSLRDPDAPEGSWVPTKPSKVMASFKNLENGNHTLRVSHDKYRSFGVVVDYFEVTTLDDDVTPTDSPGGSSHFPSSTSQLSSKASATRSLTNLSSSTQGSDWETEYHRLNKEFKIALGVISAVLALVICSTIFVYAKWIRPWMKKKEKAGDTPSISSPTDVEKKLTATGADEGPGKDVKSTTSASDGTEAVASQSVVDGSKGKTSD